MVWVCAGSTDNLHFNEAFDVKHAASGGMLIRKL
jgi:hypothetical protein